MGDSRLRMLVEASSLAAAALYGYGWVIASLFYGTFDVAPEEVGIGFAYVTIRVFIVVAVAVVLVFLAWVGFRQLGRLGSLELPRPRSARIANMLPALLGAGLSSLEYLRQTPSAIVIAGGLALAVAVALVVRGNGESLRVNVAAVARVASWVFAALALIVVLVITPAELADELADDLRAGREVELRPLFGITLVRVDRVKAVAPGMDLPPCIGLLGSANGTVVLYDAEARIVHRIPQEQVTLTSPCESSPISQ